MTTTSSASCAAIAADCAVRQGEEDDVVAGQRLRAWSPAGPGRPAAPGAAGARRGAAPRWRRRSARRSRPRGGRAAAAAARPRRTRWLRRPRLSVMCMTIQSTHVSMQHRCRAQRVVRAHGVQPQCASLSGVDVRGRRAATQRGRGCPELARTSARTSRRSSPGAQCGPRSGRRSAARSTGPADVRRPARRPSSLRTHAERWSPRPDAVRRGRPGAGRRFSRWGRLAGAGRGEVHRRSGRPATRARSTTRPPLRRRGAGGSTRLFRSGPRR